MIGVGDRIESARDLVPTKAKSSKRPANCDLLFSFRLKSPTPIRSSAGAHMRLRLSCLEEIGQYVLSWGHTPAWLSRENWWRVWPDRARVDAGMRLRAAAERLVCHEAKVLLAGVKAICVGSGGTRNIREPGGHGTARLQEELLIRPAKP